MFDPATNSLVPISDEQAARTANPVFKRGEEVTLKGVTFVIADIAPKQIKLKVKGSGNSVRC